MIADLEAAGGEIVLIVHWIGSVHTELRLPRRRRGQRNSTAKGIVEAVRLLARICSDDVIAGLLNRNDLRTGHGNRFTRERVTSLRSHHHIPVHRPEIADAEGWMNLSKAAARLGISAKILRIAAERGHIDAVHPLGEGPWLFNRSVLEQSTRHQHGRSFPGRPENRYHVLQFRHAGSSDLASGPRQN